MDKFARGHGARISLNLEKMEQQQNASEYSETVVESNVDRLVYDGREIVLVGTAHISHSSVELAERVIRNERPDTVCVELCRSRFDSLRDPDRWKNTDILEVIRSGRAYVLLAQLFLVGFQKKLGDELKIKPGAEMMRSVAVAEELGFQVALVDREVRITLKRAWRAMSPFRMAQLVVALVGGLFGKQEITAAEIERLKASDALEEAMREFADALPQVRMALIDERDRYLSAKIKAAPGQKLVVVVGAGHVPGIKRYIQQHIEVASLEEIPAQSWWALGIRWGFPIVVIGILLYAAQRSGAAMSFDMIKEWAWVVSCFAAVGALLALAHPLSIVAAFITAPLTPFNPIIKAGRAAALTEAVFRRPRVSDFEQIAEDMGTLSGFFRNRVSRILLILCTTTAMNWIGVIWGTKVIASLLGS